MREIPEDIMKAAKEVAEIVTYCGCEGCQTGSSEEIGKAILAERTRCISIAQSIDPHNEAEAHLIETIVRKMRGDE